MSGNHTATVNRVLERPARIAETREALALLHGRDFVFEVRALDVPMGRNYRGTIAGYYDNLEKAALDVQCCDDRGAAGVFTTLNPCLPAVLARSVNRLTERPKQTTGDSDTSAILLSDLRPRKWRESASLCITEACMDSLVQTCHLGRGAHISCAFVNRRVGASSPTGGGAL
jgi:hypothetical protein